jgi:glutaconyl-CoA/methylmalonyl-CoA decarboxylase subunit gamma
MKIHVKIQNKTYEVRIGDIHARPIQATVDGESFDVWPEEMTVPAQDYQPPTGASMEKSAQQVGIDEPSVSPGDKIRMVKAPIPGTIISISVAEGEQVKHGQELCVLEAMKMKNAIRSGRDGKIAKISVKEGDSVQHSQVLMEYSD